MCLSCQAGEDTWYMGHKCEVRMTRARLAAACLAVLLVMATLVGLLAFLAVRRYRALLIQAKVDQTRSRYTNTVEFFPATNFSLISKTLNLKSVNLAFVKLKVLYHCN